MKESLTFRFRVRFAVQCDVPDCCTKNCGLEPLYKGKVWDLIQNVSRNPRHFTRSIAHSAALLPQQEN